MSLGEEECMEVKRTYEAPRLRDWGNVVDLTQLGGTSGGGDTFNGISMTSGSVTPAANPRR